MKLNRSKLRALIREAVLKEFLDSGDPGPGGGKSGDFFTIITYINKLHAGNSRQDALLYFLGHIESEVLSDLFVTTPDGTRFLKSTRPDYETKDEDILKYIGDIYPDLKFKIRGRETSKFRELVTDPITDRPKVFFTEDPEKIKKTDALYDKMIQTGLRKFVQSYPVAAEAMADYIRYLDHLEVESPKNQFGLDDLDLDKAIDDYASRLGIED